MEEVGIQNVFTEERQVEEVENDKNVRQVAEEIIEKCEKVSLQIYPPECYDFVERCLRVKDYDMNKTVSLVLSVGNTVKGFKHLFLNHDTQKCAMAHNKGLITVLKSLDEFGRKVWLFRVGQWHPNEIDCDQMLTTSMLLFIWTIGESKVLQRNGIVVIVDMKNFGLEQLRGVSVKTLTKLVVALNDASPLKVEVIHFIFHPRIFGPLFKILKPFVKEKLSKRTNFHGDSTSSLLQFVKSEFLPETLGGKLGEVEAVDVELIQRFVADQSYASEMDRLGSPKK